MKLEKYVEDPRRRDNIKRIFYMILVFVVLFDIAVHIFSGHRAEHFFGDKIWGFWTLFGFIGCILLIIICKGIGHTVLMKKEDYYH